MDGEWILEVDHSQLVPRCPTSWAYLRELLFRSRRRSSPADYAAMWGDWGDPSFEHAEFLLAGGDVDWVFFHASCRSDWLWFVKPVVGASYLPAWQAEAARAHRDVTVIVAAMFRLNGSVDPRLRAELPMLGRDEDLGIEVMTLPRDIPGSFFSVVAALLSGATLRFRATKDLSP